MNTNDDATPRPWRVCQYNYETYVGSNDGVSLWDSDGALYKIADGVLIVRAVNVFEDLVRALVMSHAINGKCPCCGERIECEHDCLVRTALAAAKGD